MFERIQTIIKNRGKNSCKEPSKILWKVFDGVNVNIKTVIRKLKHVGLNRERLA